MTLNHMNITLLRKTVLFTCLLILPYLSSLLTGCTSISPSVEGENTPPPAEYPKIQESRQQQNNTEKKGEAPPPLRTSPFDRSLRDVSSTEGSGRGDESQTLARPKHSGNDHAQKSSGENSSLHAEITPVDHGISGTDNGLVLNFDHADLSDVIMTMAELLNINYLLVTEITGDVTIQTSGSLSRNDLFPLFYQILEINGLTAVREGNLYKIVSFKEASRLLPTFRTSTDQQIPITERGAQIQIIPLRYIKPEEMVKILTPFISAEGSIITHDKSKTILLVDQRINIEKALRLVETFDVNMFNNLNYRFIQLHHVAAKDISEPLQQIISLYTKDSNEDVKIIELEKMNSLLVFTSCESLFAMVDEFINKLDKPSQDASPHIYIYFLKNSQSEEMLTLLDSVFTDNFEEDDFSSPTEKEEKKTSEENPFAIKPPTPEISIPKRSKTADFGSGTLRGEIKFTEDPIRNALIIEAIPSDYAIIEKVLKRLDILPRQVLISVTILEIRLDDGLDLGVEWSYDYLNGSTQDTPSFWQGATGGDGLLFAIGQVDKWRAAINALAQEKKINILSTPSVLASDNKDATINIATEIPVASAQIQYDDDNTNRTQTDIQYRNTGIILNVTPHINEFGLVSMEISQEVSEQSNPVQVGDAAYPSFFKRSVQTTLTVHDDQTIVIGGLIRETEDEARTGVPFLMDIPGIGWLFSTTNLATAKSELIILIKPSVVTSLDDVDAVTDEFATKVGRDLRNLH